MEKPKSQDYSISSKTKECILIKSSHSSNQIGHKGAVSRNYDFVDCHVGIDRTDCVQDSDRHLDRIQELQELGET